MMNRDASQLYIAVVPATKPKSNSLPVLLIHGFCEDHRIWDGLVPQLSESHTVILVDLPGFGQSACFEEQPQVEDYAKAIGQQLQERNISEFIIIGHSLGGYIGLELLAHFSAQVKGLMLFHSSAYADTPEKKENRTKTALFLAENGTDKWLLGLFDGLFSPKHKELYQQEKQLLLERAKNFPVQGVVQATLAMRDRRDHAGLLRKTSIPIGFAIGKEDQAVPLEVSLSQLAAPKNTQAFIWEDVGHLGLIEAPKLVEIAILQFVSYCISVN